MPTYPTPKVAVQPTCTVCGSAVYCGGTAACPSSSLQLSYDAVPQNQEAFTSVMTVTYVSMDNSGNRQYVQGKGF